MLNEMIYTYYSQKKPEEGQKNLLKIRELIIISFNTKI